MVEITQSFIESLAGKATKMNYLWLQEKIAFATKVPGDWIVLSLVHQSMARTDSPSVSVSLYRWQDDYLHFVGVASRQLRQAIVRRYHSPTLQVIRIAEKRVDGIWIDAYLAATPIKAYP